MEPLEDRRFLTTTTLLNDQTPVETKNTTHTWSATAALPHTHETVVWTGGPYPGYAAAAPPAGGATTVDYSFDGEVFYHKSWRWERGAPGGSYYPRVQSEWWTDAYHPGNNAVTVPSSDAGVEFQVASSGFEANGARVYFTGVNLQAVTPDVSLLLISDGSEDPALDAPAGGPKAATFRVHRAAAETQISEGLEVGIKRFADASLVDPAEAGDFSFPDSVTIPPGMHDATFEVAIRDDSEIEAQEGFELAVADAPGETHYFYQPDAAVESRIADNDWQIEAFRLGFDGDQTITRDQPTGHSYDGDAVFGGNEWIDLGNGNGGVADGDAGDGWTDLNGNGAKDPGEVEQAHPVSYVRSGASFNGNVPVQKFINMTVLIDLEGVTTGTWKLKGTGEGFTFEKEVNGGNMSFNLTADKALADTIDYYEDFTINWTLERTPPKAADAAGNPPKTSETYGPTKNTLYVTGAAAGGAFHTVINIGCRTAKGKKPDADPAVTVGRREITALIWEEFADNSVFRVNSTKELGYSHAKDNFGKRAYGNDAAEMLARQDGRGQCTAWADFLVQTLAAQGVAARVTNITSNFRVRVMPAQGSRGNGYLVTDFAFHQAVRVGVYEDRIYDPSYGGLTIKTDWRSVELKWEDENVVSLFRNDTTVADPKGVADLTFTN